ncbi:hypothetical protein ABMY26_09815 [Azospirillum sp. HJ39]|uniref:hypothetical protein n=1 Tax=Azospirillum sp. HJ39 TaxID=3159496 RepID=UPI003558BFD0
MANSLRRVLVCEYVTGGALCNGPLPADLMAEADAMVAALVGTALRPFPRFPSALRRRPPPAMW